MIHEQLETTRAMAIGMHRDGVDKKQFDASHYSNTMPTCACELYLTTHNSQTNHHSQNAKGERHHAQLQTNDHAQLQKIIQTCAQKYLCHGMDASSLKVKIPSMGPSVSLSRAYK